MAPSPAPGGDGVLVPTHGSDSGDGGGCQRGLRVLKGGCGWAVSSSRASWGLCIFLSQKFLLKTLSCWSSDSTGLRGERWSAGSRVGPGPAPEQWSVGSRGWARARP